MGATSLKRKASAVDKLHNLLLDNFQDELAYQCDINVEPRYRAANNPSRSWRRSSGGRPVFFYLWSRSEKSFPSAFLEPGLPAVLLYEEDEVATDRAWVSWVEKWQLAKKSDDFELLSVSLRFY